jgi:hypothetical protein
MEEGRPMTRKIAYCIAHYGKPYFAAAVEAMYDQVDRIVVLYASSPSQGFRPDMVNPDTEQDLMTCCNPFWDKVTWVNGTWGNEGEHVESFRLFAADYDWAIRFDTDEIFPPGMVDEMIRQAEETNHRDYRIPFVHHWQSFGFVCRDAQMPIRLNRLHGGEGEKYLDSGNGKWVVNHMGYAQPSAYIAYKLQCSGHRPEFRPDWYEKKWLAHAQTDVHPVIFNWWNAEPYDIALLPEVLKRHTFYGKDPIC